MTTICPTNEAELIELFRLAQDRLGWRIVDYTTRLYPDAIIENAHGEQLTVEFELQARNFWTHGHDPAGCDLIICWANNWPDAPLPVWALQECRAITDFLPFIAQMADFMGRRIAREIQMVVFSLKQAWAETEAHLEQDRKREQELVELRRKVSKLELDITYGPKEPYGWHRLGHVRVYTMSKTEFDRFDTYLESLYNQIPEAKLFWAWWGFQGDLISLSAAGGGYMGFDMSHPAWTGKPARVIYSDWALDVFYNGWPETSTDGDDNVDPMPWLWEQTAIGDLGKD